MLRRADRDRMGDGVLGAALGVLPIMIIFDWLIWLLMWLGFIVGAFMVGCLVVAFIQVKKELKEGEK